MTAIHRLKKLRIDEVSLVDRGANQHAHVAFYKRDGGASEETLDSIREILKWVPQADLDAALDEIAMRKAIADAAVADAVAVAVADADAVADEVAKHGELRKPRVDLRDDALLRDRMRLPITGLSLAAQAVTGQPNLTKRDEGMNMNVTTLLNIAKSAAAGEEGWGLLDRGQWIKAIRDMALQTQRAGETEEQAFARYIEEPVGALLYRAFLTASAAPPDPAPPPVEKHGDFGRAMNSMVRLAAELRKQSPGLTEAQAFAKVYESPANVELRDALKAEEFARPSRTR